MNTWPGLRRIRRTIVPGGPGTDGGRDADPPGDPVGRGQRGQESPRDPLRDPLHDPVVLVVGDGARGVAPRVCGQVEGGLPGLRVEIAAAPPVGEVLDALLGDTGVPVLVVVTNEVGDVVAAVRSLSEDPRLSGPGWILVTDADRHADLAPLVSSLRLRAVLPLAHGPGPLLEEVADAVAACLLDSGADGREVDALLGDARHPDSGTVIAGLDSDGPEAVGVVMRGIERVLGPCPQILLPEGTVLTRQDEPVAAVHLLVSGGVALRREAERTTVLLHRATTGPIIGLVSLVRGQRAYFTATTTAPTMVVRLSNAQLERLMREDPDAAEALTSLAVHSLTRRLVRAEELHIEKNVLAADLEADRVQLTQALEDLRSTRAELVERTRFAMLGELSAGIAHELNNPLSAMTRSVEHLRRDVVLLLTLAGADTAPGALRRTRECPPRSTSEERALLKVLLGATDGDRAAARRMLRLGVTDVHTATDLLASPPETLKEAELGARIGSSLRSITAASQRVTGLAQSLRSYARPEGGRSARWTSGPAWTTRCASPSTGSTGSGWRRVSGTCPPSWHARDPWTRCG